MRQIKRIIFFLLSALALNIMAYLLLSVNGYSHIYDYALEKLSKNVEADDDDSEDDDSEYEYIDKLLEYNMIFAFECDLSYDSEYDILYDLYKYIDEKTGINYIIDSVDYSAGRLINEYIQGGDESVLELISPSLEDKKLEYYTSLYEYTSRRYSKPQFYGITPDSTGDNTVNYVKFLLKKAQENEREPSNTIRNALNADSSDRDAYINGLRESVEQNEGLYKQLFVDNYQYFKAAIDNYNSGSIDIADMASEQLARLYTSNIRGKYFVSLDIHSVFEKIELKYPDIAKRAEAFKLIYREWFDAPEGSVYIIKNNIFAYFQRYGKFVDRLNGVSERELTESLGEVLFVMNREQQ